MAQVNAEPVGGPILTKGYKLLLAFLGVWLIILAWRFAAGIGAVSGLTDGYPWGIWIAFDVVTGTALACGGYAVAILAYILNKGKYHAVIRPAILTSALGYTMAAIAIIIDVGRPWWIWRIPIGGYPNTGFNWDSALLEVALCVMAYVLVLWIELSPAFLEKWKVTSSKESVRRWSETGLRVFDKILIFVVALGLLLPTMHQSSLGTVMLLAGHKLNALWHTGWIPLLFLVSCVGMGYAVVVWESAISSRLFKRPRHTEMLTLLSGAVVITLVLFLVIRFGDLLLSGKIGLTFTSGWLSILFWVETALFAVPIFMLASKGRRSFPTMLQASILIMLAGSLYRFDAYIVAYNPGPNWNYFPSLPELLITLGVIGLEIALYVFIVKRYPILAGSQSAQSAH